MKFRTVLICLIALLILPLNVQAKTYPVTWDPRGIEQTLGLGGEVDVTATFVSKVTLNNVDLWIVPELQPFVSLNQTHFETVQANTPYQVTLQFFIPFGSQTGFYDGTIHVRVGSQTYPQTLKVELNVVDAAATIGPEGGVVEVTDPDSPIYGVRIDIPPGALEEPLTISVSGSIEPTEGKEAMLRLEPSGTNFLVPATVSIPVDVNSLGDNERLAAVLLSEISNGIPQHVNIMDNSIQIELDHFSLLFVFTVNELYLVLDIPPEFLNKGDIIYTLSDSVSFDWWPGHTGMFIGEGVYEGDTIVEATPYWVRISDWDIFFDADNHLYMGARRPSNVTSKISDDAANFALDKLGYEWKPVGSNRPSGDGFSCVGLVEAAFEDSGLNIVLFPEVLPIQQFNKTLPVNEIAVEVGTTVPIPVRGVLDTDSGSGEDYDDDPSLTDITVSNLPPGATFDNNIFEWIPTCSHAGKTFTVNFEVKSKDKSVSESLDLSINVSGDVCDCHKLDPNCDGCIDSEELAIAIEMWKNGEITIEEIMEAIAIWKECTSSQPVYQDDFEDGVIDTNLWVCGGSKGGVGGAGSGGGQWYNEEIIAVDGYLQVRATTPGSANTYGSQAWTRTVHDFNDGKDWIINFKWEPDIKTVGQWHADYHLIEITDGWTDWSYGLYTHPQHNILPGTQQLYLGNGQDFSPTTWSIVIDASASWATLYEGPYGTGTIHSTKRLGDGDAWYVRFVTTTATSAGYPAKDCRINLYDFTAIEN